MHRRRACRTPRLLPWTTAFCVLTLCSAFGAPAHADNGLAGTGLDLPERRPVAELGEVLPPVDFEVTYSEGTVLLSGDPAPDAPFWVDDQLLIEVTRPDGTVARWERNFTPDCYQDKPSPPEDVTALFEPGVNRVRVTVSDTCGGFVGPLGGLMLSGAVVRQTRERRDPWALPAALLTVPFLLFLAHRALLTIRRRRSAARAEKQPPVWKPGTRPIGVLDRQLIAMSSEPLDSDGTLSGPLEFTAGPITLGWGEPCMIRFPKASGVAPVHARLWLRDGRLTVHNLVKGYSTLVGGHPVIWGQVETGDEIEIGPYRFRCIDVPVEQEATP